MTVTGVPLRIVVHLSFSPHTHQIVLHFSATLIVVLEERCVFDFCVNTEYFSTLLHLPLTNNSRHKRKEIICR